MTNFWRKYPRGVRLGLRLLGFRYDETEASKQAIIMVQMFAFLFATIAAGLLLWLGLWLSKHR
jgi:hypothetical protein